MSIDMYQLDVLKVVCGTFSYIKINLHSAISHIYLTPFRRYRIETCVKVYVEFEVFRKLIVNGPRRVIRLCLCVCVCVCLCDGTTTFELIDL